MSHRTIWIAAPGPLASPGRYQFSQDLHRRQDQGPNNTSIGWKRSSLRFARVKQLGRSLILLVDTMLLLEDKGIRLRW